MARIAKLTKRTVDAAKPEAARFIVWDDDLKGFGLKITPAGRKVFLVQYRPAGDRRNPRKYTIGEYGQVTPYQARVEAQRVLAERPDIPPGLICTRSSLATLFTDTFSRPAS